jgi:acetyltransferase-like isoleucine patch superfamily enzyme
MASSISRKLRRYAVPSFVVSAYHFFRSRTLVSWSARVQFSKKITFGSRSVVKPFAVIQSSGGAVRFGRDCAISSFDHFSTGEGDIVVGDHVRFAPNCTVVGGTKQVGDRSKLIVDQPEVHPNGITIGDDVLVGAGSVILPASRIGRGAVIGAGSVVNGDIPEYAIVAGAPAKVIGYRE